MKTFYPPKDCHSRTLTHDEIVRVDAFSMGPADFCDQRHARYDRRLMQKLLERELPEEKPHGVGALQRYLSMISISWANDDPDDGRTHLEL
jgi:hypothetical protein